jgi:phosphoglucomutase
MAGAQISPLAGKTLNPDRLIDVSRLIDAYFDVIPDPSNPSQRIRFGTSGHRGSALRGSFNERHVLAIAQAICLYRVRAGTYGPLFLGFDTHALSGPAFASALEVFAGNGVTTMVDARDDYTPTPAISHAILAHNRLGTGSSADGVVLTPSHNPPEDGGFKYNPPSGGPADVEATSWIERAANLLLERGLQGVRRVPFARARGGPSVRRHDYLAHYVDDLANVIDLEAIRAAGVSFGIDPLGGASVHYWPAITEQYGLAGTVVEAVVDPTFQFMTADWDGKIRMDCSSPYAMARLVAMRDRFDLAMANDTDADRHGIVTPSDGLQPPNHSLAAAIAYLFRHRPEWGPDCAVGKTMVSSSMIDRATSRLGRRLLETPVGFKWFVDGLRTGFLAFAGEESAGASLLRRDGSVWTTDKDGIVLGLLAAEMTAVAGTDPGEAYGRLASELGDTHYERTDAPATPEQMDLLRNLSPGQLVATELAGQPIEAQLTAAPGNGAPFGGVKVVAQGGWFAARPSGTENTYKIYAESFCSAEHLRAIQQDADSMLCDLFARVPDGPRAGVAP